MDLTPESESIKINIDILYHRLSKSKLCLPKYNATVIRCGPLGLHVAKRASTLDIQIRFIDIDPLLGWPNNHGSWVDEFEETGLADCFGYTPLLAIVAINKVTWNGLSHLYERVSRGKLMLGCAENGVRFCKAKAWNVDYELQRIRGELKNKKSYLYILE